MPNRRPGRVAASARSAFKRLAIGDLRFDASNPRIAERLGDAPTQPQIEDLLLGGEMRARELVPSFVENGYIPYEPLVVRPVGGHFSVVEGNRRLAAIRSMSRSQDPVERAAFDRHGLSSVPCLVFTGDERQLLAYLGLRHLSKTKDWSTNAKAAFVERVLASGIDLKEAARLINTSTPALRQLLLTRRLFERASALGLDLPLTGATGETLFWHLGDAVRRTRTKEYLALEESPDPLQQPKLDESKFEQLVGWLYGDPKSKTPPLIRSIRDIPDLDRCFGNERATKALENGFSLQDALEELQAAGATITGHLDRARKSVERASGGPWSELDRGGLAQIESARGQLDVSLEQLAGTIEHHRTRLE